jgi:hypothetical protein
MTRMHFEGENAMILAKSETVVLGIESFIGIVAFIVLAAIYLTTHVTREARKTRAEVRQLREQLQREGASE